MIFFTTPQTSRRFLFFFFFFEIVREMGGVYNDTITRVSKRSCEMRRDAAPRRKDHETSRVVSYPLGRVVYRADRRSVTVGDV